MMDACERYSRRVTRDSQWSIAHQSLTCCVIRRIPEVVSSLESELARQAQSAEDKINEDQTKQIKKGGPEEPPFRIHTWCLKRELQFGLDQASRSVCAQPGTERGRWRRNRPHNLPEFPVADITDRRLEVRVIEHVIELRPKSDLSAFPARDFRLLHQREIAVEVVRATQLVA